MYFLPTILETGAPEACQDRAFCEQLSLPEGFLYETYMREAVPRRLRSCCLIRPSWSLALLQRDMRNTSLTRIPCYTALLQNHITLTLYSASELCYSVLLSTWVLLLGRKGYCKAVVVLNLGPVRLGSPLPNPSDR